MSILCPYNVTYDLLVDMLRLLSNGVNDVSWHRFEQERMGQLVGMYDVSITSICVDTTNAFVYTEMNEQWQMELGQSSKAFDEVILKSICASGTYHASFSSSAADFISLWLFIIGSLLIYKIGL